MAEPILTYLEAAQSKKPVENLNGLFCGVKELTSFFRTLWLFHFLF